MQISAQQFLDHMTYQGFERPIFVELFGPLVGLEDEWRAQGASEDEVSLLAFDFDYVLRSGVHAVTGMLGGEKPMVLEETDTYIIRRDSLGRTMKLIKEVASIPLPMDYPVKDWDTWREFKPLFEFVEARFHEAWEDRARAAKAEGRLICAGIPGGYDLPRQLMGDELACLSFYTQPDLIADILATAADTAFQVLDRVSERITIDVLSVHEDLAGNAGPLVGPKQIEAHIAPYYRRVWDMLCDRGTRLFQQDSDGDLSTVLESFVSQGGINSSIPIQPAAGMDPVALRRRFGQRLAMMGGLDKYALLGTKDDIVAELERKIPPLKDQPGMVFGLDHRIVPGTPLENYRFYVDTAREMLGLQPRPEGGGMWMRMAF